MKKYKIALLGCGRIAGKHIEAIKTLKNAEIVAVCDIKEEKAKQIGIKLNIPYYTNYDEMLKKEQIDIVNILTPSGYHAKHTIDIVKKYQKNIICEKPLALKLEDADEMIKTCDAFGVRLFVVKQNRYNLPVQKLRTAIETNKFGKIFIGTIRVRWCRTNNYYNQDSWRGTWELDGGVITNQASHHIDLLLWMLGEPISVMAKNATFGSNIEVDDTAVAILKFKSGALGIIEATTATRPQDLEGSLSILGEKGSVVIEGFAVNKMKTWNFQDTSNQESEEIIKQYSEIPPNVYGFGHTRFIENALICLENNTHALVDGLEGRKTIELINAIYESVETGKEVFLRFEPHFSKLGFKHGSRQ
jgi:predicted dehydrogenase